MMINPGGQIYQSPKYETLLILFLPIIVFFIYAKALTGPFIFDDKHNIQENPHIRLTRLTVKGLATAGLESPSSYRPIANVSFALNYYFHRYNVVGYRIVNILIHVFNGILLYLLVKVTLQTPGLRVGYEPSATVWIPVFTAVIWVLHPLQTQSVSYIVQRMNSLAAMFYMMSVFFYAKSRLATQKTSKRVLFMGCVLAGLLALGSKENAATLPFFIILYEWYFIQDLRRSWLKDHYLLLGAVFLFLLSISLIYLGSEPLDRVISGYTARDLTMGQRVLTEFRVVIFYISLLIWPHPSRLNLDHDFVLSHSLVEPATTLLSIAAIVALIGLAIYLANKDALVSYCILWFFGNLAIESSVIGLEIIFEHRTYLPSMLAILMTVSLIFKYLKPKWIVTTVLSIVVTIGALWTYERNKVWTDAVTLWQDCVTKSPQKARPYNNLGVALASESRLPEAIDQYNAALRISPRYANAHYNLGYALAKSGNLKDGIFHLSEALRLEPHNLEAHNNLGVALVIQGRLEEAINHFHAVLKINSSYAKGHNNLGIALGKQGNLSEAISHFKQALRINPEYAQAHNNLGNALRRQGKYQAADYHFAEALRISPADPAARQNLEENLK